MEGKYYRHKYGGIYMFITEATNASDKLSMTVYKHIYPFEEKIYVHRTDEFGKKFCEISDEEFQLEMAKSREKFQDEINEKRTDVETVSLARLLQEKAKLQTNMQSYGC